MSETFTTVVTKGQDGRKTTKRIYEKRKAPKNNENSENLVKDIIVKNKKGNKDVIETAKQPDATVGENETEELTLNAAEQLAKKGEAAIVEVKRQGDRDKGVEESLSGETLNNNPAFVAESSKIDKKRSNVVSGFSNFINKIVSRFRKENKIPVSPDSVDDKPFLDLVDLIKFGGLKEEDLEKTENFITLSPEQKEAILNIYKKSGTELAPELAPELVKDKEEDSSNPDSVNDKSFLDFVNFLKFGAVKKEDLEKTKEFISLSPEQKEVILNTYKKSEPVLAPELAKGPEVTEESAKDPFNDKLFLDFVRFVKFGGLEESGLEETKEFMSFSPEQKEAILNIYKKSEPVLAPELAKGPELNKESEPVKEPELTPEAKPVLKPERIISESKTKLGPEYFDAKVADYAKKMGIETQDLEKNEEFSNLEPSQQKFILEVLNRNSLAKIKVEAHDNFETDRGQKSWRNLKDWGFLLTPKLNQKKHEILVAKNIHEKGLEGYGEAEFSWLTNVIKNGPEVKVDNSGKMSLNYLHSEKDDDPETQKLIAEYNLDASNLSNVSSNDKQYNKLLTKLDNSRKTLLASAKDEESGAKLAAKLIGSERQLKLHQSLIGDPKAEKMIQKLVSNGGYEKLKVITGTQKMDKLMYMGVGIGSKVALRVLTADFASKALSYSIGPVVAAALGWWRGGRQAHKNLNEKAELAKLGIADKSKTAKNLVLAVGSHESKINPGKIIPGLADKLDSLVDEYTVLKNQVDNITSQGGQVDAKLAENLETAKVRLDNRINFTSRKMEDDSVLFGAPADRAINHYKLLNSLERAKDTILSELEILNFKVKNDKVSKNITNITRSKETLNDDWEFQGLRRSLELDRQYSEIGNRGLSEKEEIKERKRHQSDQLTAVEKDDIEMRMKKIADEWKAEADNKKLYAEFRKLSIEDRLASFLNYNEDQRQSAEFKYIKTQQVTGAVVGASFAAFAAYVFETTGLGAWTSEKVSEFLHYTHADQSIDSGKRLIHSAWDNLFSGEKTTGSGAVKNMTAGVAGLGNIPNSVNTPKGVVLGAGMGGILNPKVEVPTGVVAPGAGMGNIPNAVDSVKVSATGLGTGGILNPVDASKVVTPGAGMGNIPNAVDSVKIPATGLGTGGILNPKVEVPTGVVAPGAGIGNIPGSVDAPKVVAPGAGFQNLLHPNPTNVPNNVPEYKFPESKIPYEQPETPKYNGPYRYVPEAEKPNAPVEVFSNEIKSGGSVWRSTRNIFQSDPKGFGYKGDLNDHQAISRWSETATANTLNNSGEIKNLVYEGNRVKLIPDGDHYKIEVEKGSGFTPKHLDYDANKVSNPKAPEIKIPSLGDIDSGIENPEVVATNSVSNQKTADNFSRALITATGDSFRLKPGQFDLTDKGLIFNSSVDKSKIIFDSTGRVIKEMFDAKGKSISTGFIDDTRGRVSADKFYQRGGVDKIFSHWNKLKESSRSIYGLLDSFKKSDVTPKQLLESIDNIYGTKASSSDYFVDQERSYVMRDGGPNFKLTHDGLSKFSKFLLHK